MDKAILLAVAASVCTATASLCQRKGAKDNETTGFDARLLVRLARQPAWLLGIAAMIGGVVLPDHPPPLRGPGPVPAHLSGRAPVRVWGPARARARGGG